MNRQLLTRGGAARPVIFGLVFLAAGLLVAPGSQAAIVTYMGSDPGANDTDPRPNSTTAAANFDPNAGALGPVTYISFEAAPVGSFTNLNLGSGVTANGSDYAGNPQTIVNAPVGTPDNLYGYNTTFQGTNFMSLEGGSVTFTFSKPINAFGAFFTGVQLSGESITFNDGTAETVALPNPNGGAVFVGFTDGGKSITSVTVNASGDAIGVDDVRFSTIPEPSTVTALLLAGVAAGMWAWRRALPVRLS